MKYYRFAVIALLTAGICLTGLLVLVQHLPIPVTDVYLVPHGIQTNSTGRLCMLVGVTNRSSRTYGVAFASQTTPGRSWTHPFQVFPIKHFGACPGQTIDPNCGIDVLVPLPRTSGPWRVAVGCFDKGEKIPDGNLGRWWRSVRMRFNRSHYLKLLVTPAISTNQRCSEPGPAVQLTNQIECHRRLAPVADHFRIA